MLNCCRNLGHLKRATPTTMAASFVAARLLGLLVLACGDEAHAFAFAARGSVHGVTVLRARATLMQNEPPRTTEEFIQPWSAARQSGDKAIERARPLNDLAAAQTQNAPLQNAAIWPGGPVVLHQDVNLFRAVLLLGLGGISLLLGSGLLLIGGGLLLVGVAVLLPIEETAAQNNIGEDM